jgi:hypothetical protein
MIILNILLTFLYEILKLGSKVEFGWEQVLHQHAHLKFQSFTSLLEFVGPLEMGPHATEV